MSTKEFPVMASTNICAGYPWKLLGTHHSSTEQADEDCYLSLST